MKRDLELMMDDATANDIEEVAEFEVAHFDSGAPYTSEDYTRILNSGGHVVIVRNAEGDLLGAAAMTFGPDSHAKLECQESDAYLAGIVVHRDHRGYGLSGLLLRKLTEKAYGNEVDRMVTLVRASNRASMTALSKSGFQLAGSIQDCMPVDEPSRDSGHRLILAKDLPKLNFAVTDDEALTCQWLHDDSNRASSKLTPLQVVGDRVYVEAPYEFAMLFVGCGRNYWKSLHLRTI